MTNADRNVLVVLALGVGLVWASQLKFGSEFGLPGITTGTGQRASKRDGQPKRGEKGPTKPGDGVVIDVDSPKVVNMSEWETKRRAARARARLENQKKK
jgi:hypothetical protein